MARGGLQERMDTPSIIIERARQKKSRRSRQPGSRQTTKTAIDIKASLMHAEIHDNLLRFRLRVDAEGGARPREVVMGLLGERLPDHLTTREQILVRKDGELVGIDQAGACPRPPAKPRTAVAAPAAATPEAGA